MKHKTTFIISKKPGPMGILVETSNFKVVKTATGWIADKDVLFRDNIVNVYIVIRGQQGQPFEMKMSINNKEQDIKGVLVQNGLNEIRLWYPLVTFFPAIASVGR